MKRLSVLLVTLLFISGCTTTPSAISKGELVNCASLSADSTVTGTQLDCLDGSARIVLEDCVAQQSLMPGARGVDHARMKYLYLLIFIAEQKTN